MTNRDINAPLKFSLKMNNSDQTCPEFLHYNPTSHTKWSHKNTGQKSLKTEQVLGSVHKYPISIDAQPQWKHLDMLTCDLNDSQESTDHLSDEVNYAHTHSEVCWHYRHSELIWGSWASTNGSLLHHHNLALLYYITVIDRKIKLDFNWFLLCL